MMRSVSQREGRCDGDLRMGTGNVFLSIPLSCKRTRDDKGICSEISVMIAGQAKKSTLQLMAPCKLKGAPATGGAHALETWASVRRARGKFLIGTSANVLDRLEEERVVSPECASV